MAPGRRKGANKAKTGAELRLGDLVLAKVKGFPAWPAKISRPEEWERAPDPKKYFVQFFGTQEIAFVGPADVQPFTSESKSKVLARCKGKTVKYFSLAVKEICEAFEELQKNDLSGPDDNTTAPRHDISNVELGNVNGSHAELSGGSKSKELFSNNFVFDRASLLGDSSTLEDLFNRYPEKRSAAAEEFRRTADFHEIRKKFMETVSGENKTDTTACQERIESSKASSSSSHGGLSDVERKTSHQEDGKKDISTPLGASGHLKFPAGRDKKSANGHKSKELTAGAKRKIEVVIRHTSDAKSGGHVKDWIPGKVSTGGNAKRLASGVNKLESNMNRKTLKSPLKDQKHFDVGKNSPQDAVAGSKGHGDVEYSRQKDAQIGHEQSQSIKKAKHIGMISDAAKGLVIKNEKGDLEPEIHGEDAVEPVAKHRRQALEAMSDTNVSSEDKRSFGLATSKNDVPKKRRAVRLYDDDDEPKTPVHGGSLSGSKLSSSALVPDSIKKTDENHEYSYCSAENLKGSSRDGGGSQKDYLPSAKSVDVSSIAATLQQKVDNSTKAHVSHSPGTEELDKWLVKEVKTVQMAASVRKLVDKQKANKPPITGTGSASYSKVQNLSAADSKFASGGSNSSQSQIASLKNRQPLSGERAKNVSKTCMKLNEPAVSLDNTKDHDSVLDGRLEDAKDGSGSLVDSKGLGSAMSMKHLIAAAQAKRRQAHMQNEPHGNGNSMLAPTASLQGRSPSPSSRGQAFSSSGGNVAELDAQGVHLRGSFGSPSVHIRQLAPQSQLDSEEPEDKGLSSGLHASGSALSGGTEAAVARDAFEGMIETLSRTKESIARATRLAIDCAKYGIANEVVDLLIRKLENEPNFHRRVDLLFLVDSITQCSHSQKGIAGASYIPTVQAALPRLLGAAAPPGASARENRKQCLKVLRLWLERKILPESVLRRFMDDIGGSNDDTSSGISFRRPSRAERSVDDPIRGMEGMLVDEYGSNATFNLPGFLSAHGFVDDDEEEEGVPSTLKEYDASPLQPPNKSPVLETGESTPIDRRHHILEEVDGELEMEDVSGHLKDGAISLSGSSKKDKQEIQLDTELQASTIDLIEPPSLEGSPPLPPESPPPLPPLPSSPPPPPPPPLSPSPPPPPPPPSMLPSQPPPPSLLSSEPLQAGNNQPMLPPPPSMPPQVLLRPPSVVPPVQAPLPPGYNIPTGNHPAQMAGNTMQQATCFLPAGASGSHDASGYTSRKLEYGQSDVYVGPQAGQANQQFQHNQQFQPCRATFVQRSFPPVTVPQPPPVHFTYNKPTIQQHVPHPCPQPPPPPPPSHPYTSVPHSEGLRRFSDEQWRSASAEYKADNQHNTWVNGGRMPSCPTTNFIGEAYFRPPERAVGDNVGYNVSAPNPAMGVPSTSGHGINQMLPPRSDMSSLNCWRPV